MATYITDGARVGKSCGNKKCKNCHKFFPTRAFIDGKSRDLSIRKYCLDCSPFKGRNSKQLEKCRKDGLKTCKICSIDKPIELFMRPSNKTGKLIIREQYCPPCRNIHRTQATEKMKKKCIQYKGGQCQNCGYKRNINALSFHHRDPSQKDFQISSKRWYSPKTFIRIQKELDKCDLLCLNCHTEEHSRHPSL